MTFAVFRKPLVSSSCLLVAILISIGVLCLHASDEKSWKEIEEKVQKLWEEEDFVALEKLAETYRHTPMRITESNPPITIFYQAFAKLAVDSDSAAQKKSVVYDRWLEAFPDSVTARTAYADFLISEAWRARGSGWAREVNPEAWPVFKERLREASAVLYGPGMDVFEKIKLAFLNLKTNRKNYIRAQEYARGEVDLETTLKNMSQDEHLTISLAMIATIAFWEEKMDEVDRIVEFRHRQRPFCSNIAMVESFGWGGIRRAL